MKKLFSKKFLQILGLLILVLVVKFNLAQTTTYNFTGSVQTYTVPPGVFCIQVDVRGAKGGGVNGGNGARVQANLNVTPGQVLEIWVGGMGSCPDAGWNGGGAGVTANGAGNESCGGGGASDIRIAPYGLSDRIVVAAGGGGMGGGNTDAIGGAGGCVSGSTGNSPFGFGGYGGTQTAGGNGGPPWISSGNFGQPGSFGYGGDGGYDPCYDLGPGGGGGGGLYGGGGGGSDCWANNPLGGGGGGGGSSLVPAGGSCTPGFNNGNGQVIITVPVPISFIANSNSPVCIGHTLNLSVTNLAGGNAPYSFSWLGPNGFTSTLQNPSINNVNANHYGNYTVIVSSNNGCLTASSTINVQPGIIPNLTLLPDDTSICAGSSVIITANADVPGGTFSWSSGEVGNTTTVTPSNTQIYTVTYNLSGCSSTATATVKVNPLPVVTIDGDVDICLNESTLLTASGGISYIWNTGNTNSSISVTPVLSSTYTVTATDIHECISSSSTTVEVNPLPVASFTSNEVCEGNNTTLINTSTVSTGTINSSNWSVSPVISSGANAVNHLFPSGGNYPVTLTVTTDKGCTSSVTQNVVVHYNPVVNITSDITEGCEPLCVNFFDQSTVNNATIVNWNWKSNNQVISSSQNPNYCFSNNGQYSIQLDVVSSDGCFSTQNFPSYINVFPSPKAAFEPNSDSVPINSPTILFINLSQNGFTYQWDFGDGFTSNDFSPMHTYNTIGQFCIELLVTSNIGCTALENKCIKVYSEHFVFIPNSFSPNGDELNELFVVRGYGIQKVEMWIFDRWGKELFYSNKQDAGWDGTELNSSKLMPNDTYVYKIRITDYKNIEKDYFGFINLIR